MDRSDYSTAKALQRTALRTDATDMQSKVQLPIIAGLAAAIATVLVALLLASPSALAQTAWVGGSVEDLPSSIPSQNDFSGVSVSETSTLYTVDNKTQVITVYSPSTVGYVEEYTIPVASVSGYSINDAESVTWMSNSPHRLAVVDEGDNDLIILDIANNGSASVHKRVQLASAIPAPANKGIEGLSYSHDESSAAVDVFYVGTEGSSVLYRIEVPTSGTSFSSTAMPLGVPEISGLAVLQGTNEIYIVSQPDEVLYSTTTTGATPTVVMSLSQFQQPEGVTVHPSGEWMFVVGEGGPSFDREIAQWSRTLPAPTPTPTPQPTPPPTPTPGPTPPPTPTPQPTPQPTPAPPSAPEPWTAGPHTVSISDGNDDVEEALGWLNVTSGDLDAQGQTTIGLRFTNVCVTDASDVASVYLQLTADEADFYNTTVTIRAESVGDASPFGMSNKPNQRSRTAAAQSWSIPTWTAGQLSDSPDITALIAEVVSRPDWQPCNDIALLIEGVGDREAVSYETDPARAPRLMLETNGIGNGGNGGGPINGTNTVVAAIDTGADDVEERLNRMIFGSGDVDLSSGYLTGLRYDICIPQGATIDAATVTFVADEADTRATTLTLVAHDVGDAPAFSTTDADLSSRPTTSSSAQWSPPVWGVGDTSDSADIASVIAEVTGRADWSGCGHIALVISGSGDREAISYETNSALAPRLSVTWTN